MCRAYVDIFAVIFCFHDAPFIIALCLVLMSYRHLLRVHFGRSPAELTLPAGSLRPTPIKVKSLFGGSPFFASVSYLGSLRFNSTEIKTFSFRLRSSEDIVDDFWTCLILLTEIKCFPCLHIFQEKKNIKDNNDIYLAVFPQSASFALCAGYISPQRSDPSFARSFSCIVFAMAVLYAWRRFQQ